MPTGGLIRKMYEFLSALKHRHMAKEYSSSEYPMDGILDNSKKVRDLLY